MVVIDFYGAVFGPICIVSEIQRFIGQKLQISLTPFYIVPSFGVTPFEFLEKLYGF